MSTSPRQSQFAVLGNPALRQTAIGAPRATADLTERINVESVTFPGSDMTVREILTCNGRDKSGEVLERISGTFEMQQLLTDFDAAWAAAEFFMGQSSTSAVAAGNEVQTLTITATGGTYRLVYDDVATDPLAFDANAATIETAIELIGGSGNLTVAGTGPFTITGTGTLASTDIPTIQVLTDALTGGTASIAVTTPGGDDRVSRPFTQATSFQPYAETFIIGAEDLTDGILISDAIPARMEIATEASGLYRLTKSYIWRGVYQDVAGLSIPECPSANYLSTREGRVMLGATDVSTALLEGSFTLDNGLLLEDGYTLATPFFRRLERATRRDQQFAFTFDQSYDGAVFDLARANGHKGTSLALEWRMGSTSYGFTLTAGRAQIKFANGSPLPFGGPANRARVAVVGEPWKAAGDSASYPVAATAITDYDGDFLATA
jgi:hypothetical protein